jgi:hypothetical protein
MVIYQYGCRERVIAHIKIEASDYRKVYSVVRFDGTMPARPIPLSINEVANCLYPDPRSALLGLFQTLVDPASSQGRWSDPEKCNYSSSYRFISGAPPHLLHLVEENV